MYSGRDARSVEFIVVHLFPSEIVVLGYETPPIDNIDDREGDREQNTWRRVDFADGINDIPFGQSLSFTFLTERLIGC